MRLLIVSQYFWPEDFRVNELVRELVLRGHTGVVLTGFPNYPGGKLFPEFQNNPSRFASFEGAKVIRVPHILRGNSKVQLIANYVSFFVSASLCGLWRLRGEKFDGIFVFQTSPVTVGIASSVIRAVKKAPVAFWVLDQWPETLQAVGFTQNKFVLRTVGLLVSWIYRRCDVVLAPARTLIPQIASYCGGVASKVVYFPNWSDPVELQGVEPAAEIPHCPGVFNVLFAGNIGVAQDFEAILDAIEELKSDAYVRWVFVGDGRMAAWLKSQVEARNLTGNVQFVGRVPAQRMPSFFVHADALLVSLKADPIFSMTVPGKLQTYLAAGKPVLAMLNGEGADVVHRARAGMTCDAGDAKGLARIVRSMKEVSATERIIMGENGREYCAREFGKKVVIDRLENVFSELTKSA